MNNFFIILIGAIILWQGYELFKRQSKLKKELRDLRDEHDKNIDYSGHVGSGISMTRKNYPDQEVKDNFREKVSEPTKTDFRDNSDHSERHNIAGSMNGPSEMQKKAFSEDNK